MIPEQHTIYIVEDDASLRNALRRLLMSAHYRVLPFASAEEFFRSDFTSVAGYLLLDIKLPGISGFELLERLRASGVQMPVIIITSQDREGMEERAMRLGATAYLRKPVDEETLLSAIRRAMESVGEQKSR